MCQAGLTWEKKIWILTTQISEICFLFPARLLLKVGDILLHMIWVWLILLIESIHTL